MNNDACPLGFDLPAGTYLVLYLFTLIVHVVFMNYVLAGTGYLAFSRILTRRGRARKPSAMSGVLADWLPAALSAAITAGVAPLLFIQILYRPAFYTANLLLFHRWMVILPVLIVAFYLLYIWKSRPAGKFSPIFRTLIGVTAFACFAFTGYTWTENHVLSVQSQEAWSAFHASGDILYHNPEMLPRLLVWFVGSFPTMCLLVAWQMWYGQRRDAISQGTGEIRMPAAIALVTLLLCIPCAWFYYGSIDELRRNAITTSEPGVFLYVAAAGVVLQLLAWSRTLQTGSLHTAMLTLGSIGLVATLVGTAFVRETMRLLVIDRPSFHTGIEDAWQVGGLGVFLLFFLLCGVAIAYCVAIVRRSGKPLSA